MSEKVFILYDDRACGVQGTDDAAVLVSCESDKEARSYKGMFGGMACYSYGVDGKNLINEQWEWDYFEEQK